MKSSMHLFYGIIIGILICACTGSLKTDMAEFDLEKIEALGNSGEMNEELDKLKKEGWTIIDVEVQEEPFRRWYAHVGK
jgi:hypothetical protein